MNPTASEVAWAAGLFEGEGTLTISSMSKKSGKDQTAVKLKLCSTDEDIVQRFADIVEVGQIREDDSMVKRGWKLQWEWYTNKQDSVIHVVNLLKPYFGKRRTERADEILDHIRQKKLSRTK